MDDDTFGNIFIGLIISMVILIFVMLGAMIVQDGENEAELSKFINEKHVCPECGWIGNTGECKYIGGEDTHECYYCPECGKLLGEFNE